MDINSQRNRPSHYEFIDPGTIGISTKIDEHRSTVFITAFDYLQIAIDKSKRSINDNRRLLLPKDAVNLIGAYFSHPKQMKRLGNDDNVRVMENNLFENVVISANGKRMIRCSDENLIEVWNLETEKMEKTLTMNTGTGPGTGTGVRHISKLLMSHDGSKMIYCLPCYFGYARSENYNAYFVDISKSNEQATPKIFSDVNTCTLGSNGWILGFYWSHLHVANWDTVENMGFRRISDFRIDVKRVEMTASGIYVALSPARFEAWDTNNGNQILNIKFDNPIHAHDMKIGCQYQNNLSVMIETAKSEFHYREGSFVKQKKKRSHYDFVFSPVDPIKCMFDRVSGRVKICDIFTERVLYEKLMPKSLGRCEFSNNGKILLIRTMDSDIYIIKFHVINQFT